MTYVSTTAPTRSYGPALFFGSLLAVTFAPLLLVPALAPHQNDLPRSWLLAVLVYGHVGSNFYLYGDRGFRPMLRENWLRFVVAPLVFAASLFIIAGAHPETLPVMWLVFFCWQLYHFGRQNFGVVMFASKTAGIRPPASLGPALNLTAAAAILGLIASETTPLLPRLGMASEMRWLGGAFYAAAFVLIGRDLYRQPELLRSPLMVLILAAAALFFLPSLTAGTGHMVVFWSYALAHGAQYLIFMAVLAWQAPARGPAMVSLVAAVMLGGVIFLQAIAGISDAVLLGLTMGHFLIDAKAWKMRGAKNSPIRDRFAFVC